MKNIKITLVLLSTAFALLTQAQNNTVIDKSREYVVRIIESFKTFQTGIAKDKPNKIVIHNKRLCVQSTYYFKDSICVKLQHLIPRSELNGMISVYNEDKSLQTVDDKTWVHEYYIKTIRKCILRRKCKITLRGYY